MGVGDLFWNGAERRLRAFWRIAGQLALSFGCAALPLVGLGELLTAARHRGFLSGLGKETFDQLGNVLLAPFALLGLYLSLRLGVRWIERRSFAVYGSTPNARFRRELLLGMGFATLLMTLVFALEWLSGAVAVTGHLAPATLDTASLVGLLYSLVKVAGVGVYEEWISRGVVLRNLAEGLVRGPAGSFGLGPSAAAALAIVLSSALFSLLHWTNPNIGPAGLAGIFLIGVLLGTAYVTTGRLALSMGFHMAWNLVQGVIYGLPVSGDLEPIRLLEVRVEGSALWTGGSFGPEAGLVAMAVVLAGIAALLGPASRSFAERSDLFLGESRENRLAEGG
jgi:membrane protease YdiL (CAAX protease family)